MLFTKTYLTLAESAFNQELNFKPEELDAGLIIKHFNTRNNYMSGGQGGNNEFANQPQAYGVNFEIHFYTLGITFF